uniref:BZIP domain-containing protein n=2 Tax=Daucus carota subsp. sativus TaxID=79200 RepID=A0A166CIS2_DAUCS
MMTPQRQNGSGSDKFDACNRMRLLISDDDDFDENKRKRMQSNREAARRSRMKKQQHVHELITEIGQLQNQCKVIMSKINQVTNMFLGVVSENNASRAQLSDMTKRFHLLKSVVQFVEEAEDLGIDVSDVLMESPKFPCPKQQVPTSANMFDC